jgi:hypothetical protein
MKVRDLLAQLNELTVSSLDKEIYIDVPGDEYKEMELVPIVDAADEDEVVGFVICEATSSKQLKLSSDEVH